MRPGQLRCWSWLSLIFLSVTILPNARGYEKADSVKCAAASESADAQPSPPADGEAPNCASDSSVPPENLTDSANAVRDPVRQVRETLQSKGIEFHGFLKTEATTDFHSGLSSDGTDYRGLLETSASLDLEKAFHWKGGRVSASLHDYFGSNGSEGLIEDAQGFSNIDSQPMNRIYELWFEQTLAEGKVRFKAGRIDANTEFAYVENATEFLNSSMGFSPTILGFDTYPAPRTGGLVELRPSDSFYATLGDFRCPIHGDMAIGEIGTRWRFTQRLMPGRFAFGSWIHPHNREGYLGMTGFGVHGYYLVAEQTLWKTRPGLPADLRGVRAFAQWGSADPMFSGISQHAGGGAEWIGPFSSRPADVIGLGITRVRLGEDYYQLPAAGTERSVESFYKLFVRSWISFTADMQRISSSSSLLAETRPYVATLRATLSY